MINSNNKMINISEFDAFQAMRIGIQQKYKYAIMSETMCEFLKRFSDIIPENKTAFYGLYGLYTGINIITDNNLKDEIMLSNEIPAFI